MYQLWVKWGWLLQLLLWEVGKVHIRKALKTKCSTRKVLRALAHIIFIKDSRYGIAWGRKTRSTWSHLHIVKKTVNSAQTIQ